jgi:hypothetical protein
MNLCPSLKAPSVQSPPICNSRKVKNSPASCHWYMSGAEHAPLTSSPRHPPGTRTLFSPSAIAAAHKADKASACETHMRSHRRGVTTKLETPTHSLTGTLSLHWSGSQKAKKHRLLRGITNKVCVLRVHTKSTVTVLVRLCPDYVPIGPQPCTGSERSVRALPTSSETGFWLLHSSHALKQDFLV